MKAYRIIVIYLVFTVTLSGQNVLGDTTAVDNSTQSESSMLQLYFFLFVFATIVNRMVEYIKIILQRFLPSVFTATGDKIWLVIKNRLDALKLDYNLEDIREKALSLGKAVVLHTIGFVIGLSITFGFEFSVLNDILAITIDKNIDYFLGGLLIGSGVDPVHSLFRWVEEKKEVKQMYRDIGSNRA